MTAINSGGMAGLGSGSFPQGKVGAMPNSPPCRERPNDASIARPASLRASCERRRQRAMPSPSLPRQTWAAETIV